MTHIGISIINYQAAEETVRCVESLQKSTTASKEYFLNLQIADNGSEEEDFDCLRTGLAGKAGVVLSRHEANLGFAAGHNRNIARLFENDEPDFIWLLNNDCEVPAGTIEALLCCAGKRPEVGIWGATLLETIEGPVQCAGGCTYHAWLSSFSAAGKGQPIERLTELPEPRIDYIAGASLFMPTSTLTRGLQPPAGRISNSSGQWLNEEFFLYFEELDLARRLRPGLEMGWCREAIVVHAGGSGTGSTKRRRSRKGEFHSTLSALKFTELYLPNIIWLTATSRLLAKTLVNLITLRFDLLGALYSAYSEYFAWRRSRP